MAMSDRIEAFIIELLKDAQVDGLEIGRNELAGVFNCVPSQINYVIKTRFSPERGYIIESRRGGGGYIKIKRRNQDDFGDLKGISDNVKNGVGEDKAENILDYLLNTGRISTQQKDVITLVIFGDALKGQDEMRGKILKDILMGI